MEPKNLHTLAARLVCEMLGHAWKVYAPPADSPLAAIMGEQRICSRCGRLDR